MDFNNNYLSSNSNLNKTINKTIMNFNNRSYNEF